MNHNNNSHYSNNIESTIAIMINATPKGLPATQITCFLIFVSRLQKKSRKTMVISFPKNGNLEVTVTVGFFTGSPSPKKTCGSSWGQLSAKKARLGDLFLKVNCSRQGPFTPFKLRGPTFFGSMDIIPSSWFKWVKKTQR